MSAARMGQPSPALGDWWGSAILTGTASPIRPYNASTQQTKIWYMNNNVYAGGAYGPILPAP